MITQQISLDELDIYKVSVETKKFVEIDGVLYQIGSPHRRVYSNSEQDRILISEELAEPYLSAVMSVWGEKPNVFPHLRWSTSRTKLKRRNESLTTALMNVCDLTAGSTRWWSMSRTKLKRRSYINFTRLNKVVKTKLFNMKEIINE